jgi:hypothetical protein
MAEGMPDIRGTAFLNRDDSDLTVINFALNDIDWAVPVAEEQRYDRLIERYGVPVQACLMSVEQYSADQAILEEHYTFYGPFAQDAYALTKNIPQSQGESLRNTHAGFPQQTKEEVVPLVVRRRDYLMGFFWREVVGKTLAEVPGYSGARYGQAIYCVGLCLHHWPLLPRGVWAMETS